MQRRPPTSVIAWLDRQPTESIWTTAITVFEIQYGLERLPEGKRRRFLEEAFESLMAEDLGSRILAFDVHAARASAAIASDLDSCGQRPGIRDVQIAGIARAHQAPLATRNTKDFERCCEVINPWDES